MPNHFRRNLLTGFVSASILLIIISFISYNAIRRLQVANNWVAHTLEVIGKANKVSSYLEESQQQLGISLLNGKLINVNQSDLSTKNVSNELSSLRNLVSDNPPQVRRIDSLIKYSNLVLNQSHKQSTTYEGSLSVSQTNMLHCKVIVDDIVNEEKRLLVIRKKTSESKASSAVQLIVIFALISVTLLGLILYLVITTFNEKLRLSNELKVSETKFASIFTDSGIGMATIGLDGRWLDVNPYLAGLLGYNKQELLDKTFVEMTYIRDINKDVHLIESLKMGEIDTYKIEKRIYHQNGSLLWVILTVSLIRDQDGAPGFFVVQIENISNVKGMIAELEIKNEVLSHTTADLNKKITQLEEFNRIVAHNLRGPAGSINMMLKMLKDEQSPEELQELLDLVLGSSNALNATLDDLMEVLEIRLNKSIDYDDCSLEKILDKTCDLLMGEVLVSKALINPGFNVKSIRFPKVYLESLFYNMISNSLKYSKKDTPVAIRITSEMEDEKVKLVFEDNGLGIDLNLHGHNMFKLNKVFHRGFNSKGVGLFITKNQLETHGACIKVESEPANGTRFIIYFTQ